MFGHGYGGGLMWIFWILVIVALIWLVVGATRGRGGDSGPEESALEILRRRYARGEIDREEFEQRKKDLEK